MRKLFKLILAFFFGGQALAQKTNTEDLSILFVGNSFTHMNEMPFIFDRMAKSKGKSIHVEMNTRSGATFHVHTTRPDLFEAINSRQWDFVVLQGMSRELTHDPEILDTATMPYIRQILDSVYANDSCTNVLLYMTWGYKEGYPEREDIATYELMADKIALGYQYLSDTLKLPIVPVGMVWKEVCKKYPEMELYDADKMHPGKNGSYIAASTFYTALFNESPEGAITSTISNENAPKIQKIASDYVLNNYTKYGLDVNRYDIKTIRAVDGKFMLHGKTNFPEATSVNWDFGDGTNSTNLNPTHRYQKPGIYKITLTIEDTCGTRLIERTAIFKEPKKPVAKPKAKPKKGNTPKKKI
ncbi:MAG: PKD domain-containing protein [Crocinitomicaceae bacterium]